MQDDLSPIKITDRNNGLVWTLSALGLILLIASCQLLNHPPPLIADAPTPLLTCPEPVCPDPLCPEPACPATKTQPQTTTLSAKDESTPQHPPNDNATPNSPINVNTASVQQLCTLPGIGPQTAQKIIDARLSRPFRTHRDLLKIKGIGRSRLNTLKHLITLK